MAAKLQPTQKPLMPKATAVWLVDNTTLTFEQIAAFCGLHALEIEAIADGDVASNIVGRSPVLQAIVTDEDIKACEQDPSMRLTFIDNDIPQPDRRTKGPRYTPVNARADKPDGIAYIIKTYPDITDAQIIKLLGTTKATLTKIRNRTLPNMTNVKPRDPVQLGLCSRSDLDAVVAKAEAIREAAEKKAARAARKAQREKDAATQAEQADAQNETVETTNDETEAA
ncbi:MAG TPA: cell cycle transcriptional regulator TrcR [Alphaproteobacteria bacterium]